MASPRDNGPSAFAWSLALVSLVLPWIGGALVVYGGLQIVRSSEWGWHLLATGLIVLAADVVIDLVWAHPSVSRSDEPALNSRAHQLIGRACVVSEAIRAGRGKVRIADTEWAADGTDVPAGSYVTVVGARGTVLQVEPLPRSPPPLQEGPE